MLVYNRRWGFTQGPYPPGATWIQFRRIRWLGGSDPFALSLRVAIATLGKSWRVVGQTDPYAQCQSPKLGKYPTLWNLH